MADRLTGHASYCPVAKAVDATIDMCGCGIADEDELVLLIANAKDTGPVHLAQHEPHEQLSWCGMRTQFRHVHRDGEIKEVTCTKCLRQIKQDRPLAYGGS